MGMYEQARADRVGRPGGAAGDSNRASAQRRQQAAARTAEFFEAKVRPVLAANCYDCHAEASMGGLRLDSREAMLKGGRSGPAIVPGDPDKSLLIQAVRQTSEKLKMPKGGRLKPDEIEALSNGSGPGRSGPPPRPRPSRLRPRRRASPNAAPIRAVDLCHHAAAAGVLVVSADSETAGPGGRARRLAEDRHRSLRARATRRGGPEAGRAADKRTLIRRATLDLTGLPPTPEEIDAFEKDDARMRSRRWSIACSRRRATAKRGAGSGSTSRATARTTTARSIRKAAGITRIRTPISIATG